MRFVLIIITITFSFQMLGQIPKSEQEALRSFYHATNGDNWYSNTNWNTNNPIDTWYGISIIEVDGVAHINSINLYKNNLSGIIPAEIGQLTQLTILNIAQNKITGSLPKELKNCKKLSFINIEGNQITVETEILKQEATKEENKDNETIKQKQVFANKIQSASIAQIEVIRNINKISKKLTYSSKQTLIDAENKRHLDEIARLMLQNKDLTFVIEGHTDNNNSQEFNIEVGEERAKVVKNYLEKRGVSSERLFINSLGEKSPISKNDTEENKQKNRRLVFNLKNFKYTITNTDWTNEKEKSLVTVNKVEKEVEIQDKKDNQITFIPLSEINRMPVFPGCEGNNTELKECFIENIQEHFDNTFNIKLMQTLGLPKGKTKIYIKLLLDKTGKFLKPEVRAPHKAIKREIEMMVSMLPELEPGIHKGKFVNISYTFPYFFKVK